MLTILTFSIFLNYFVVTSAPILSDVRNFFQIIQKLEKEDLERIHAAAKEAQILEQELGSSEEPFSNEIKSLLEGDGGRKSKYRHECKILGFCVDF